MFELAGRVALVTGAGSAAGIGYAAGRALGRQGAAVALTATSERVHERARELALQGVEAWAGTADLVAPAKAAALVEAVLARFDRIDVLVNNAGMTQTGGYEVKGRFEELDPADWALALDRSLATAVNVTRLVLPGMLARGSGRVVFVSSVTGPRVAIVGSSGYATAKAALEGLMRALALETGGRGVTVNAVAPGWIATGSSSPAELAAGRRMPVGRPGTTDEVAAAVVFLACAESSYVTGHSLVVDGGNTLQEIKGG